MIPPSTSSVSAKPHPTSSNGGAYKEASTEEIPPSNTHPLKTRKVRSKKIKKLKDPLAPRRPLSAFLMFCGDERPKVVAELGSKALGPVAGELGKRWAALDKDAKEMWEVRSREAKKQFEEEQKNYRPSEDYLLAAAAHDQKLKTQTDEAPGKMDKMSSYFTHLLSNWVMVATYRPDLTPKEVQEEVWQKWNTQTGNRLAGKGRRKKKVKDPRAPKHPMSAYLIYLTNMRPVVVKEQPKLSAKEVMAQVGQMWKKLSEEDKAPYVNEARKKSEEYYQEMGKFKGYF